MSMASKYSRKRTYDYGAEDELGIEDNYSGLQSITICKIMRKVSVINKLFSFVGYSKFQQKKYEMARQSFHFLERVKP
jgi:hypothetical protein